MPAPAATVLDYLAGFQRLLPLGRIWHRGWGMVQDADLLTLMPTWARLHAALTDLIDEIFPCSTMNLLPEWEASLGLPDECTGPLSTIVARRNAVCGKFTARGGQSRQYFINLAASLGFEIRIEEFSPFYAGHSSAGDPCGDEEWAYTWRVIALQTGIVYFAVSVNAAGDPLAYWGNHLLECELERYKPAHTKIVFSYSLTLSEWDEGLSIWDGGTSIWDKGEIVDAQSN